MQTVKEYEKIPLSDKDVSDFFHHQINILTYPQLSKCQTIEDVLGPYNACFILYESRKNYGHWTLIFKTKENELEFFNSYGGYPDLSLSHIPTEFRLKSNQYISYLSELIIASPYQLNYNEFKFQKEGISTCGKHCCIRLFYREFDIYEYHNMLNIIKKKTGCDYDAIVTVLYEEFS